MLVVQVIRSLHDPQATLFRSVSELQEENGVLYIGSYDRPFVGKLNMADLPPANQMPGDGGERGQAELTVALQCPCRVCLDLCLRIHRGGR